MVPREPEFPPGPVVASGGAPLPRRWPDLDPPTYRRHGGNGGNVRIQKAWTCRRSRYVSEYGVMASATKPPYTTLTAYDLNTGTINGRCRRRRSRDDGARRAAEHRGGPAGATAWSRPKPALCFSPAATGNSAPTTKTTVTCCGRERCRAPRAASRSPTIEGPPVRRRDVATRRLPRNGRRSTASSPDTVGATSRSRCREREDHHHRTSLQRTGGREHDVDAGRRDPRSSASHCRVSRRPLV